jgi:hypothetical protein
MVPAEPIRAGARSPRTTAGPKTRVRSLASRIVAFTRETGRREIATRGLTPAAVAHLTRDALGTIDLAALAPVKKLLKRFFSDESWTGADDRSLAELVGPGRGWWQYELDDDLALEFGWREGSFRLELSPRPTLAETFDGPVVPEATPNPHTIRFITGTIHDGPSRWYESATDVDDPRVLRLFTDFDAVANVLVGPDFVAVGLRRPDEWELVLDPMLRVVTAEFAPTATESERSGADAVSPRRESSGSGSASAAPTSALDRAWRELAALRPEEPADLDRILAARLSPDAAHRQVAARLLIGADADTAEREWGGLLADSSRSVRRAAVDAMVDAERPALRALLERALLDADAWTRWKALRGIVGLGIEPSRSVVAPLADDPDFRVRLEATGALRVRG